MKDDDLFNIGTTDYTISIWLKVSEENSTTRMVPWQESGALGTRDNQTWLRLYSTSTNQLTFATEDENGGSTIHLTAANSPEVNNIANGEWRNVVCVRAGTKISLYVDGVERRSATTSAVKNVSNAGDFKIGFQESGYGNYINKYIGAIDKRYRKNLMCTTREKGIPTLSLLFSIIITYSDHEEINNHTLCCCHIAYLL